MQYGLGFIRDSDLYDHVKKTVLNYRFDIDLKSFNKSLVDPIKLTFDSKIYQRSIESVVEDEVFRQLDKSNTNQIGYFHQNIFKYLHQGWKVPEKGFDVINEEKKVFVEMKNKHNTMNSSSAKSTYIRMQNKILSCPDSVCYLVEVIAKESQDIVWKISNDGSILSDPRIRRMSIDKFYGLVTNDPQSFKNLCSVLPSVLDDVVCEVKERSLNNTVMEELKAVDHDILKSLYMLSFKKYEGFDEFSL
ncbi:Eco47II family restriction endonuclease [Waddlia chondrophila]|uniref:Type II site-specific deoxyribonuclease n=1 Tax=Waddlia chondrophila (strain ATCC VR-1470 / WSU 86-1044) TaxID=716544 RepID=D6YSJ0_WADCW|nr:Eco47II family restriction endonuclease [Waddlia chondrophila]ADI39035.1 Type II site-specific deoxyribonuclease [Waddlia chondrophila WSU 86-1044]